MDVGLTKAPQGFPMESMSFPYASFSGHVPDTRLVLSVPSFPSPAWSSVTCLSSIVVHWEGFDAVTLLNRGTSFPKM
jgi:hypothetical protein